MIPVNPLVLKPCFGLILSVISLSGGYGMGYGVHAGISLRKGRVVARGHFSYSRLSVEQELDTLAPASGSGFSPGLVKVTHLADALELDLAGGLRVGGWDLMPGIGLSWHTSGRAQDETSRVLESYPDAWVPTWGMSLGRDWDRFGFDVFLNKHQGDEHNAFLVAGGRLKLFPGQ